MVDRAIDPASAWTPIDLTGAAMLHTDACLRLVKQDRESDAVVHLDSATRLLHAAVDRDLERAEFARRWRDVVAGLLHAFGVPEMASTSARAQRRGCRKPRRRSALKERNATIKARRGYSK